MPEEYTVTPDVALDILLGSHGKWVGITVRKRDGEIRTMEVQYRSHEPGHRVLRDLNTATLTVWSRHDEQYRTIRVRELLEVRASGHTYTVEEKEGTL